MDLEESIFHPTPAENNVPSADDPETVDLAGYQVTRPELFSHSTDPSITLWYDKIKFNMACLKRFPGATHINLYIHPDQRRLIIRPCDRDAPNSLRWAVGGGEREIKNRDMICKIFAAKVFDLMDWGKEYRYKLLGKPAVSNGEVLFLFKLTDFEMFVTSGTSKRRAYFPLDWRDCFGLPVEESEKSYNIDLAEGYISTDGM